MNFREDGLNQHLRFAKLTIFDPQTCKEAYHSENVPFDSVSLCAGSDVSLFLKGHLIKILYQNNGIIYLLKLSKSDFQNVNYVKNETLKM